MEATPAAAGGTPVGGRRVRMRRRLAFLLTGAAIVTDLGVAGAAVVLPPPASTAAHAAAPAGRVQADPRRLAVERTARGAAGGFQDPARHTATSAAPGRPTRIRIPAIGVDAVLQRLTRNRRGVLQPPDNWTDAGWYTGGVAPGAVGPAVIAGHLDTTKRAAVFVDLRLLRPGDRIQVTTAKGRTLTFIVTRSDVVRKALFPTSAVYGPTPDAELRLITCSEPFDATEGVYADNLVVYAVLNR